VVHILLENGADPNIAGKWGITARYAALQRGDDGISKILSNPPVNVEKKGVKLLRMQFRQNAPVTNRLADKPIELEIRKLHAYCLVPKSTTRPRQPGLAG
jgi:hypothetical protein